MKRQTIATTYGLDLARLVEQIDRARECQLVVVEGRSMGRVVPIHDAPVIVGAANEADLVLDDDRVSARHAELMRVGQAFRVRDLGSTNGILFQGAIVRSIDLPLGGTFTLGQTPLRIQPAARYAELPPSPEQRFGELVGKSLPMRELFAVLELAAQSDATLLVEGETGTGKELVARSVHDQSRRRKEPFVAVDCGALPENLIESALFGHVRGAFTGADDKRLGAFVQAHKGTLFLDEIGNLPAGSQARLLRALETRSVRPVGADAERAVDVRVIAAARVINPGEGPGEGPGVDLDDAVKKGHFRADLFYRLAVVRVRLPPLRARLEDLEPTVREILERRGFAPGPIGADALAPLRAHPWPGNVRELRNVLERALALSPGARDFASLRLVVGPPREREPLAVRTDLAYAEARAALLAQFDKAYLADLQARFPDNLSAMARAARLDRKTLRGLLTRHGLIDVAVSRSRARRP